MFCTGLVPNPPQKDAKLGHNPYLKPCVSRLIRYVCSLRVPPRITDHPLIHGEMRARLTELRRGKLYLLRPWLCALENYSEALIIFKFGVVKGAKVTIKELKPVICHELND